MAFRDVMTTGLLALLTSLAFAVGFDHPVVHDAVQYDALGWNLAQGRGFSLESQPPYAPTMFREPLYPALLAATYRLAGHRPEVVPFVQVPLFIATCWLTAALGWHLGGPRIGWWAGVTTACMPVLANYPSYLLTETLFILLLAASVWCVCRAWSGRSGRWWAAAGALQGATVLCRAVAAPLSWIFCLVALAAPDPGYPRLRRAGHVAISMALCVGVTIPWILRNQRVFGEPAIALRGEMVAWIRANKLDDTPDQIVHAAVYNLSEYVGHRLFPHAAVEPRDVILGDSEAVSQREHELMAGGLSRGDANRRLGQEAWERIREHPVKYVLYTPIEMLKLTAITYVPTLNEQGTIDRFERLPHGRLLLALVRGALRSLAYPLLVLAGYGIWIERRRWHRWWPIGVTILYINIIHGLLFSLGRYAVPLVPLYLLFAVAGFAAWRAWTARLVSPAVLEESHALVR